MIITIIVVVIGLLFMIATTKKRPKVNIQSVVIAPIETKPEPTVQDKPLKEMSLAERAKLARSKFDRGS